MTDAETRALARSRAVAGLCPITEANLGDGIFPATEFFAAGGRFGVGSDSNVLIDAAEELRLLEYGQRLTRRGRNILASAEGLSSGGELFRKAVSGGAQALGIRDAGLQEDASADIVSLDPRHAALASRRGDEILDSLVFAARGGAIDCVWRGGRKFVEKGRHVARERIVERYRDALSAVRT
jgi:formiminoglutamate deiminase